MDSISRRGGIRVRIDGRCFAGSERRILDSLVDEFLEKVNILRGPGRVRGVCSPDSGKILARHRSQFRQSLRGCSPHTLGLRCRPALGFRSAHAADSRGEWDGKTFNAVPFHAPLVKRSPTFDLFDRSDLEMFYHGQTIRADLSGLVS